MPVTTPSLRPDKYKYQTLADELTRLIRAGTFRPGARIPSVRQLSRQKQVSISTVLQAYYRLEDRGLVEARHKSGYYVLGRRQIRMPEPEVTSPKADPTTVSVHELVMMVLQDSHNPDLIQLGPAIPSPGSFTAKKLNSTMLSILRHAGRKTTLYEMTPGNQVLRSQIARRALNAGCHLTPDDIIITSGCTEAMNLCLRAVCRPGDTVATESPTYFGVLQNLEFLGLNVLEIPTHPRDGVSLEALRFAVENQPIHACLFMPNFNNPLGSYMPDEKKQELVDLLARHEIPLIENDISGELYLSGERPRAAKAFDRYGGVMLCSSFSKDLCPGFRVGWAAPGRYSAAVERLKIVSSLATPTLPQLAMAQFLSSGGYDHHLRRMRRAYAHNIAAMSRTIKNAFPKGSRVTRPRGGYLLWVELPEQVDSLELYKMAIKSGITITPGPLFSARRQFNNFIRLNAAGWSPSIEAAVYRLGQIIEEMNCSD